MSEAAIGVLCGGPDRAIYVAYIDGGGHVGGLCVADVTQNPAPLCVDHLGNECAGVVWIVNNPGHEAESVFIPPCF